MAQPAVVSSALADRLDAVKIFDAWFGPKSAEPMARKFKIQADH